MEITNITIQINIIIIYYYYMITFQLIFYEI